MVFIERSWFTILFSWCWSHPLLYWNFSLSTTTWFLRLPSGPLYHLPISIRLLLAFYSISLLLDQISLMSWINSHNSCISLQLSIGRLSNAFLDTYVALLIMVSFYIVTLLYLFMPLRTLVRLETKMTTPSLVPASFILVAIQFPGVLKGDALWHAPLLKLSINR